MFLIFQLTPPVRLHRGANCKILALVGDLHAEKYFAINSKYKRFQNNDQKLEGRELFVHYL